MLSLRGIVLLICTLTLATAQPVVVVVQPQFSSPKQIVTYPSNGTVVNVTDIPDLIQFGNKAEIDILTSYSKFAQMFVCPGANTGGWVDMMLTAVGDENSGSTLIGCTNLTSCDVQHHFCTDPSGARVNMCSGRALVSDYGAFARMYGYGIFGAISKIEFSYRMNDDSLEKEKRSKKSGPNDYPKAVVHRLNLCSSLAKNFDGQTLEFTAVLSAYPWSYPDYAVDVIVSTDALFQNVITSNSDGANRVAFVYVAAKMPELYVTIRNTGSAAMTASLTGSFQTADQTGDI